MVSFATALIASSTKNSVTISGTTDVAGYVICWVSKDYSPDDLATGSRRIMEGSATALATTNDTATVTAEVTDTATARHAHAP